MEGLLIVLQFLLELFGETLLQVAPEQIIALLEHVFLSASSKPHNRLVAILGYLMLGQAVGWISWLVIPHHLITNVTLRVASVFVTPALTGLVAMLVGFVRYKKGETLVRLDRFGYAYLFAFSIALARFAGSAW